MSSARFKRTLGRIDSGSYKMKSVGLWVGDRTGMVFYGDAHAAIGEAGRVADRLSDMLHHTTTVRSIEVETGIVGPPVPCVDNTSPEVCNFLLVRAKIEAPNSIVPFLWQVWRPKLSPTLYLSEIEYCLEQEIRAAISDNRIDGRARFDVILDPWLSSQFVHEVIGHSLEADNFLKYVRPQGLDFGSQLADFPIHVRDDPTAFCCRGSYLRDNEGTLAQAVDLIRDGVLTGVLTDEFHSKLLGVDNNGHARMVPSATHAIPRMSVTSLQPGFDALEDLISAVDDGILCVGTWGGGSQGKTFVLRPAYGIRIRFGKLTDSFVRKFDLIGEKFEALSRLDGLSREWKMFNPFFGCDKDGQVGLPVSMAAPYVRLRQVEIIAR
jgi:predicted Zn-dependent protease